jgi:hypothetical protein
MDPDDAQARRIWLISARIAGALSRSRVPVLTVALAYFISVLAGIVMVHSGNDFALSYRDELVAKAQASSVLTRRSELLQVLADFRGNALGAAVDSVLGLGIVLPCPTVVYRGWVGGIVSVDSNHASRLAQPQEAAYYLSVVFLQLLGYALAAGAGIYTGLSSFRARPAGASFMWFKIKKEVLQDVLWVYALVLPILLIASLWEFLSPWN